MNLERLRIGEWIFGVSGIVLLVSLFLPWWGLEGVWTGLGPGGPVEGGFVDSADPGTTTWTAWQVFSVADVLLGLLGVLAIVVWVLVARWSAPAPGLAGEVLLTPFAIAVTIVVLAQVLGTPEVLEVPPPIPSPTLQPGAWLGLLASCGVLFGLLVGMRDERLSEPGRPTDQTGAPVAAAPPVEKLPGPPAA
jgi:hypothetical protein